jgi:hypothetical protein
LTKFVVVQFKSAGRSHVPRPSRLRHIIAGIGAESSCP